MQTPSDSENGSPVYFYAHGNGGNTNLNLVERTTFYDAGYSVISWESVTTLDSPTDIETCWSDLELVWKWFLENAEEYNFDVNRAVIGGRSRGSICSWKRAHSADPNIVGIYMFNALPDGAWLALDPLGEFYFDPEAEVTANSPPAYLAYGPECPKPILQTCDPDDGHNPRHGQTIVERSFCFSLVPNSPRMANQSTSPSCANNVSLCCSQVWRAGLARHDNAH